jgi:hypothetical protein
MRLRSITGSLLNEGAAFTLYKGAYSASDLDDWPALEVGTRGERIPGFLAGIELAMIYADPELTGSECGMLAEFQFDPDRVEDRTLQYREWCEQPHPNFPSRLRNPDYDVSTGYPSEWMDDNSLWTVMESGSAHGDKCFGNADFVYSSALLPYVVKSFYADAEEWQLDFDANYRN